jgi:hypothetical protein
MASGEAESTRIRLLRECIVRSSLDHTPKRYLNCDCPTIEQPKNQEGTTPDQLSYVLDKAIKCPIRYTNPNSYPGCQPTYTVPIPYLTEPGTEPPQGPAVQKVFRKFEKIRGIDQICRPLTTQASSARTSRIRANILAQSDTRYVQTVIPLVPYPPCPAPRVGPQPGVPIAPMYPCINGNDVDFTNPIE